MRYPKSILITGASSGIGESLARHYAGPSVTLFLAGQNLGRLLNVAGACEEAGATVFKIVLDVTDSAGMSDWISQSDRQAPLDIIIANAGISGGTSGAVESAHQVRRIFKVNIDGVLNTVLPGCYVAEKTRANCHCLITCGIFAAAECSRLRCQQSRRAAFWRGVPHIGIAVGRGGFCHLSRFRLQQNDHCESLSYAIHHDGRECG
jgi:NADP-dependent 3-hydroxy acid dehydrogenase YdfG